MSQVVVVARMCARAGGERALLDALEPVARATHAEAGCLAYAVHRDRQDARALVVVSRWTSAVALEAHTMQPYVRDLGARLGDLVEAPPQTWVLDPLALGDPMKGAL